MGAAARRSVDAAAQMLERYSDCATNGRSLSPEESFELYETLQSLHRRFQRVAKISDRYQSHTKELVVKLQNSLSGATFLGGIFHICASCKKLRNDSGQWQQFEQYITDRSDTVFSHGICPSCASGAYGVNKEAVPDKTTEIRLTDDDLTDAAVLTYAHIISSNIFEGAQLYMEFRDLFTRYVRQLRRTKRIVRISDSFQSELRQLSQELEKASRTDQLTGINNRAYFMQLLMAEIDRSRRYMRNFSVMMIDLDHFKKINDSYGHAAGDAALQFFVKTLENSGLRDSDFWGRLGGEEFAVVLPETVTDQALVPAERIRSQLADGRVTYMEESFTVTASIGVSQYQPGDSADSLLSRADKAMYRAKDEGRNRVCTLSGAGK